MRTPASKILAALLLIILLVPAIALADTLIFHETCQSGALVNIDSSSASISVGTAWSARIQLVGAAANTIVHQTGCNPSADSTDASIAYTMDPSPTTDVYYMDYIWGDGGAIPLTSTSGTGILLNYIDTSNYYACELRDDATPDAYLYKVTGGVGSVLTSSVDRTVVLNDVIECKIDYSGASPIITMRNVTTATQLVTATDSSGPLTKTKKAGIFCGATPASTTIDCESLSEFDVVKLTTVPDVGGGGASPTRRLRLFGSFKIKIMEGKIVLFQM